MLIRIQKSRFHLYFKNTENTKHLNNCPKLEASEGFEKELNIRNEQDYKDNYQLIEEYLRAKMGEI
jgi:hypothetical protein